MEEIMQCNNVIKYIEKFKLKRELTKEEKSCIETAYYLGRQHQYDEIMDDLIQSHAETD